MGVQLDLVLGGQQLPGRSGKEEVAPVTLTRLDVCVCVCVWGGGGGGGGGGIYTNDSSSEQRQPTGRQKHS